MRHVATLFCSYNLIVMKRLTESLISKSKLYTHSIGTVIYDLALIAFACHYHMIHGSAVVVGRAQGRNSVTLQLNHILLGSVEEQRRAERQLKLLSLQL